MLPTQPALSRLASAAKLAVSFMPYEPIQANSFVYFDVTIEQEHVGRVTIELFNDTTPQCAENFRSLCTGERGTSKFHNVSKFAGSVPLHYRGIPFHRIVPNFIVQGGDIVHKDGRGNISAFGYPFAADATAFEGKGGKHLAGTVALAHSGKASLGSQFFFNLTRSSQLDGKFPVVGQVVEGWDCVRALSKCGSRCGTPVTRGWISECGQSGGIESEELAQLDGVRDPTLREGREVLDLLRPRY
eukprot:GILI01027507.1.p1 GENE.GILI01027507.1~~GILI01027507.1.p1  ORF type:complete len:244 (-),score=17.94 GILI01027507.1:66-797(-)